MFMNIYKKEHWMNHIELRDRLRGHISPCILRNLTYFDVGHSFVSDSLHNVYHGVVVSDLQVNFCKIIKNIQDFLVPLSFTMNL